MTSHPQSGLCPAPFLQEDLFATTGGYTGGRFCQSIPSINGTISCCLPCPMTDWRYPDNLPMKTTAASWLAVGMFPLTAFILITYAVLPVKFTNRHYLTICFTLANAFLQIPFIIPLGTKPDQCHDAITPNDMTTSLSCAFTGFILLYGGVAVVTWCLLRTIALHLQVCWEVVIGAKFMWLSFLCGWGLPAVIITIMGIFTGVSYRFGDVCHINGPNSTADYWIPILVITAISLVLQATTLIYCINVYVRSLFDSGAGSTSTSGMHSGLPSYSGSVRTMTARQAYKRIRRVLQLQWRSVAVVLTIIVNVIYFCVVFLELNKATALTPANLKAAMPWLACLVLSQGNANECVSEAGGVSMNEAPILAVLFLLPLAGLWNFIFVVRTSMFTGWIQFARGFFVKRVEFVSADARERVPDVRTYEMLSASRQQNKTPDPTIELARSPTPGDYKSNVRWSGTKYDDSPDTYGPEAKYSSPTFSFSSPRPPSASHTNPPRQWDVSSSFAPSMPNYSRHSPEGRR